MTSPIEQAVRKVADLTSEHEDETRKLRNEHATRQGWRHRVSLLGVWKNPELSYEQRRDEIVRRLRASEWFRKEGEGSWLHGLVDELADAPTPEEFDTPWSAIYDEADADRVWIER